MKTQLLADLDTNCPKFTPLIKALSDLSLPFIDELRHHALAKWNDPDSAPQVYLFLLTHKQNARYFRTYLDRSNSKYDALALREFNLPCAEALHYLQNSRL